MEMNQDIRFARTLDASFYTDISTFEKVKEGIFAKTWHWIADAQQLSLSNQVIPVQLYPGFLEEPLLVTHDNNGDLHCLSNVCTHRGNLLVKQSGVCNALVCAYHGRKFTLDGKFQFMPEFKKAENFPTQADDLKALPLMNWNNLLFTSLNPEIPFELFINEMQQRLSWLPIHEFRYEPLYSQDYLVNANWALYCDNYLEGFHIPYVHPLLNQVIDYNSYTTELFPYSTLQLGLAKNGEQTFDIPADSVDAGKKVAAYYFWIFPNMMFNFYPWGCSINIVKPIKQNLTRVSFRTYLWKPELFDSKAATMLEKVEREDENIVEQVQQGVQSRFYTSGRFSPDREQGVHHFHCLINKFLIGNLSVQ
jgi:choline monooxygenase